MRRLGRILRIAIPVLLFLAIGAGVGFYLLIGSPWFREQVRSRVVREIETATGGTVELGAFDFDWRTMRAHVRDLVLHGRESGDEQPLARIDRGTVGLSVVSLLDRKVNVAFVDVEGARVNIIRDAQGRFNLPEPRARKSSRKPMEQVIGLAVGEYKIRRSRFRYLEKTIPIDIQGRDLDLSMSYDKAASNYPGRLAASLATPIAAEGSAQFRLEQDRIVLDRVDVKSRQGSAVFKGAVESFQNPRLVGVVEGTALLNPGRATVRAMIQFRSRSEWTAQGHASGDGLAFRHDGIDATGVHGESDFTADPSKIDLTKLQAFALGGMFEGRARLVGERNYSAQGKVSGFDMRHLASLRGVALPWSATVSGAVEVSPERIAADVELEPVEGAVPVSGSAEFVYEPPRRYLTIARSTLELPATRLTATGQPGGALGGGAVEFGVISRNLDELLPALGMISPEAPKAFSVRIEPGGLARITGTWTGGVEQPSVVGHVTLDAVSAHGERLDHFDSAFEATATRLRLIAATAHQGAIKASGEGSVALTRWQPSDSSSVSARAQIEGARLETLLQRAKSAYAATGDVTATIDVGGTVGAPTAIGRVSVAKLQVGGETFDSLDTAFRYSTGSIDISDGRLRAGRGIMNFKANHAANGAASFDVTADGFLLSQWKSIQERRVPLDGRMSWRAVGTAEIRNQFTRLTSIDADLRIMQAAVSGRPIGDARLTAETRGSLVRMQFNGQVRDSRVQGSAEWSLGGASTGLGQVEISRLTFATLQELGFMGPTSRPLAFTGVIDAEVGFSGPILRPETWTAVAKVNTLEIQPNPRQASRADRRFTLRNREPLVATITADGARLEAVHLVAEGTDLEVTGNIAFRSRNPFNLQMKGRLNLPVLSMFEPDLVASGVSTLDAAVRGSLDRPQVTGRMEIRDATFNLRGLPNGLERTNGVVLFDRTRANIEKLTAQTGGGDLSVTGFVGFGGDELIYRLTGQAQRVRVRYPAAVSTTFNANLNLTGTSSRSLLAGSVVLNKMGIVPRTDIGTLLAEAGRASAAPATAPNDFLRGMQLDLNIQTAPDAELQTSLARDIQPDAKFRLYGSAVKPTLIGRTTLNQGEINFFGNQYTITRGDISFYNQAKIEPVLDFDLETRVRGVTVNINFTGPVNRLDVSYRSDPPLRPGEIVALLAVGRAPDAGITPSIPTSQNQQGFLQSTNNTLLGQAISAPISGRLERLFGVSRIKIDPELTGVTNTPQARLTVEQQLSRDLTVTYITNLNRTQQQIVRVQWDFSREFSVLAVRDDNGVFGVDFLYRKRF